jgi:hypothetical protein
VSTDIDSQIQNIKKFGRYGRAFCALLAVMLAVFTYWCLFNILSGPTRSDFRFALGAYDVTGDHLTTLAIKAWALVVLALVLAIMGKGLFHLFRLFANLSQGLIYTKSNVHHIRQVGLLALSGAVLQIAVFAITALLVEFGVIDRELVTGGEAGLGPFSFDSFILAALLLLASWIMDVGRQTTDDADAMRREAELVI